MIGFLKLEDKSFTVQQHLIEQEASKKEYLNKMIKKNEFELFEISKKIELAETKYNENIGVIGLVEYLTTLPTIKESLDVELLEIIGSKAESALKKSGLATLTELRLKKELLQQERLILESTLNKIT
jgi:hypothetical protein